MTKSEDNKFNQAVEQLWEFSASLSRSMTILHWIGYGLLALTVMDIVDVLVPPQFMNPLWEFQTIGQFVERVPVPLLGFALVFFGGLDVRAKWEPIVLKLLSWVTLFFAIFFILLIPLGIVNTIRLENQGNQQIAAQVDQGLAQIKQVKQQLDTAKTPEQISQLLTSIDNQGRVPQIENAQQAAEAKNKLTSFIATTESQLQTQASATKKSQQLSLLKNSVKWNLGALISATLFIMIWQGSSWARGGKKT